MNVLFDHCLLSLSEFYKFLLILLFYYYSMLVFKNLLQSQHAQAHNRLPVLNQPQLNKLLNRVRLISLVDFDHYLHGLLNGHSVNCSGHVVR